MPAAALAGCTLQNANSQIQAANTVLPAPAASGIEHILVVRSDEIANLASALNFSSQNTVLPALPVIKEPGLDPCTLWEIFESFDASGAPVVNSAKATALAQSKNNRGEDNETYDFYLLLKSQRTQGWEIPASLKEQ